MMDRINDWLGKMPSTNAVIFTGMMIALGTTMRYVMGGVHFHIRGNQFGFAAWVPTGEWLLFVAAVLGVGTTHFGVKRVTDASHVKAKQPQVNARTAEVLADEVTVTEVVQ